MQSILYYAVTHRNVDRLIQVPQNRGVIKNIIKNAILCHSRPLMYKNTLKHITNIDFGREIWIKFYLKDYFLV